MKDEIVDEIGMDRDALEAELDSALRHIVSLLVGGASTRDTAWWLFANHARFLLNYQHAPLLRDGKWDRLRQLADLAGSPPVGKDWNEWIERVRRRVRLPGRSIRF